VDARIGEGVAPHYDVLAVGDYYLDLIFSGLPCFPELGKEIVGTGFAMLPGGGYNAAVAMHRLGLRVGWAADFGNDEFSRIAIDRARAEGMDPGLFVRHDRPLRRITVAASYPQDRAFISYRDPDPRVPAALRGLAKASARAVYVPGFYCGPLFGAGLALVRARRMSLFMDGNAQEEVDVRDRAARAALRAVDVFLPNAREARAMTGRADLEDAMRTLGEFCRVVVVKDGAAGAHAFQQNERHILHAAAIQVTPAETTGAGDCFNAGFIRAWLDDKPLAECLRWGNIVGGLSTLAAGGSGRRVTLADVEAWL
jgi:sugar/nucleoside kinase (ribokinase family)